MDNKNSAPGKAGLASWLFAVAGWLICAAFCLFLTIGLEAYPYAYDMLFPAVLLILFCNILVFLFIATRWGANAGRMLASVARVCVGEGLILGGMYAMGRYLIGS